LRLKASSCLLTVVQGGEHYSLAHAGDSAAPCAFHEGCGLVRRYGSHAVDGLEAIRRENKEYPSMLRHRLKGLFGACLTFALLSCSFLAAEASAQNPTDPATLHVTLVKTKPGKSAAWRDTQRDLLHHYQKSA
jgi:hypothetical protein